MAQFTAMSGRNIPSDEYSDGRYFSTIISTIWTIAAMTAMNRMKLRKLRSTDANLGPSHASAPGCRTNLFSSQLTGTVMASTAMTAVPRPPAVLTFLDTDR